MFKVTLKKIESSHNNLRTDEIEGMTLSMPELDKTFFMYTESSFTPDATRFILTSPVKEMRSLSENEILFKTLNSVYVLTTK